MNQLGMFDQLKQYGECIKLINSGHGVITLNNGDTYSGEFLKYKLFSNKKNKFPEKKSGKKTKGLGNYSDDDKPKKGGRKIRRFSASDEDAPDTDDEKPKKRNYKGSDDETEYTYDNVTSNYNYVEKEENPIIFVWQNPIENVSGLPAGEAPLRMSGRGFLQFSNKFEYEGDILNGNMTGQCKLIRKNNKNKIMYIYEGNIVNALYNGYGKLIVYDVKGNEQLSYTGMYKNHKYHGKGLLKNNESEYEGEFNNGIKEGNGKETFITGIILEGSFKNEYFTEGTLRTKNGNIYTGKFNNQKLLGTGTLKLKNGDIHEGKFSGNQLHGNGKIITATGDSYAGKFINGKKNGQFTVTHSDGKTEQLSYSDDKLENITKINNLNCPVCKTKITFCINTFTNNDTKETCSICYEPCNKILSCGHYACEICINKLRNIKNDDVDDSDDE